MRVERLRENAFRITATWQELSTLVAAARMTLDTMRADPHAPPEAVAALERVVADYERAVARQADGRQGRPS